MRVLVDMPINDISTQSTNLTPFPSHEGVVVTQKLDAGRKDDCSGEKENLQNVG